MTELVTVWLNVSLDENIESEGEMLVRRIVVLNRLPALKDLYSKLSLSRLNNIVSEMLRPAIRTSPLNVSLKQRRAFK